MNFQKEARQLLEDRKKRKYELKKRKDQEKKLYN